MESMLAVTGSLRMRRPSGRRVVMVTVISFQVPIWMAERLARSKATTVSARVAVGSVLSSVFIERAV